MQIFYRADRKIITSLFDREACTKALLLFNGFNEETGKKYYFIPKFSSKDKEQINQNMQALSLNLEIEKTDKGWCFLTTQEPTTNNGKYSSFLFWLALLYGKIDIKNQELINIKIQIPLFGQFVKYEELFATMKSDLTKEWMFISTSIQKTVDGSIYQITLNDYELLKDIARYYEPIEKISKIRKEEELQEAKQKLLEFLQTNDQIPETGKQEVINQINSGVIKLLTK